MLVGDHSEFCQSCSSSSDADKTLWFNCYALINCSFLKIDPGDKMMEEDDEPHNTFNKLFNHQPMFQPPVFILSLTYKKLKRKTFE